MAITRIREFTGDASSCARCGYPVAMHFIIGIPMQILGCPTARTRLLVADPPVCSSQGCPLPQVDSQLSLCQRHLDMLNQIASAAFNDAHSRNHHRKRPKTHRAAG